MNAALKSGAKRRQAVRVRECCGDTIFGNYWVKLGFSRLELGALRIIAQDFVSPKHRTVGHAARMIVQAGLAHWLDTLRALHINDWRYSESEGFTSLTHAREGKIAQAFGLDRRTGRPVAKKAR